MDIFDASNTEIVVKGYTKQNIISFVLHGLVYTHTSIAANLLFHKNHLCLQKFSFPSFCLSITKVPSQLPCRVLPSSDYFCRLLAHSLFFDYQLASCISTVSADVTCCILLFLITFQQSFAFSKKPQDILPASLCLQAS